MPEEELSARAMLLMDSKTGKILYQKDADLKLPPASTTKILTAILALESGRKLTETLTVSKTATRVPATKLYLNPGQTISIGDLLYGVLLSSANDAAVVLAEGIGGSIENFGEMMTKKAHELGAGNTHFTNPHGLTAPDHYSTAHDLAVIFRYAMRNPTFRQIVQTKISSVRSITPGKKKAKARLVSVRNHNRLLWNFEGAIGGKTGYTYAAQKCFVGAVERNGVTLLVSILGSRDLWRDTKRLLEYGFDNYEALKLPTPGQGRPTTVESSSARNEKISALVLRPQDEIKIKAAAGYAVQVGAFRERERADSLVKAFAEQGLQTFIEKASQDSRGETSYRVRLGPYRDLLNAQEKVQELLIHGGHEAVIIPLGPIDQLGAGRG
jgi:D-alanyl-D-alanine carboxypeptidase (penicillin-binding protein 5/6)